MVDLDIKTPASDHDAECAVLASILNDPTLLYEFGHSSDVFDSRVNKEIFVVMSGLVDKGAEINAITVLDVLRKGKDNYPETNVRSLMDHFYGVNSFYSSRDIIVAHAERRKLFAKAQKIMMQCLSGSEVGEIVKVASSMLLEKSSSVKPVKLFGDAMSSLDVMVDSTKGGSFICDFPFKEVNKALGGYRRGALYTIGARTSVGKSVFMINLSMSCVTQSIKNTIFSTEMSGGEIHGRYISKMTRKPLWLIERNEEETVEIVRTKLGNIKFKEEGDANIFHKFGDFTAMCNIIRKEASEGSEVVFIDYLQHISHKLNYNAPQTYIVGDMTTKLKHLATELGIAIVIVCQLNRDVGKGNKGDHLPKLRHLKDSGSIEQDSDVVLLLHREDLIDPETSQRNIMDVLISKNRQGKTGASKLFYEKPIFSLRDLEEGELLEIQSGTGQDQDQQTFFEERESAKDMDMPF